MENVDSDLMKEMLVWLRVEYGVCRSKSMHMVRLMVTVIGALIMSFVTMVGSVASGDVVMGVLGMGGVVLFSWVWRLVQKTVHKVGVAGDELVYVWLAVLSGRLESARQVKKNVYRIFPNYERGMRRRYDKGRKMRYDAGVV